MELYATGLNAWNQLRFDLGQEGSQNSHDDLEPDDIRTFTLVLSDDIIDQVEPFLSYTRVRTSPSGLRSAGTVPHGHEALRTTTKLDESNYFFVEASNGVVVVYNKTTNTITQYPSLQNLLIHKNATSQHPNKDSLKFQFPPNIEITQLVPYETGFAALSSTGTVYTWGDERYSACIGREVTKEDPASHPSPIQALESLPTGKITKIAAGGTILAALTSGNDLYAWGQPPRTEPFRTAAPATSSSSSTSSFFASLTGDLTPVDIDDWKDIADIAIGERHLLALTAEGHLFAIGDNANGQLGLPEIKDSTDVWTKVEIDIDKKATISGVVAGPRNSFVIVRSYTK